MAAAAQVQGRPLSEHEAVRAGLANPHMGAAIEAATAAARSDAGAAGRWPNPTLDLQRESIPSAAGRATEQSIVVSQQFDLSGRRALRTAAAKERLLAATADGEQRRLDAAGEIRRRFFEALYRQEVVSASALWELRIATVTAAVDKLHKGGEVAGYDRRRMALERASVQARLRSDQADYEKARQQLLALMPGAASDMQPEGELLPPDAPPLEALLAQLGQRPELRAAERRAGALAIDRRAAQRAAIPDVTVGVGAKTVDNAGYRERGTIVSLAVPLPLFDRDQSGIAKALAQADAVRAEAGLLRARLEGELRGLWLQLRALNAAARDYRLQAGATSGELAAIAEASYKGGESGVYELLDAYRAVHEARLRVLELSWNARQAAIGLDTIAGNGKP